MSVLFKLVIAFSARHRCSTLLVQIRKLVAERGPREPIALTWFPDRNSQGFSNRRLLASRINLSSLISNDEGFRDDEKHCRYMHRNRGPLGGRRQNERWTIQRRRPTGG